MSKRAVRAPGLRIRIAVTLVVTSLLTLGATLLIVVPPLDNRLQRERVGDLRGLALTARPAFRGISAPESRPDRADLREVVLRLRRRTGGRIAVYDAAGKALVNTDPEAPLFPAAVLRRDRVAAQARRDGLVSGVRSGEAVVVTLVHSGETPLMLVLAKPLDDTRAADSAVRDALPLMLLVGLGVAVILALLATTRLLHRLARLRADARALGEEGLEHPVAVTGGDEVAEVASALEAMRTRLLDEESSRRAFLATASHELRTPLASLQGTLELLSEQAAAPGADRAAILARTDTALRQTHRLVTLATDLLDLSRVDGGAPVHVEPLELAEIAAEIAHEFDERLAKAGRTLTVVGGPVHAIADPAAVARVVRILLDNATAYGAGAVELSTARAGERALLTVGDEGPGVPEAEREQIFVRFARGRSGGAIPGFGLGLAIARGLAVAMAGTLEVRPKHDGACFALELPAWTPGEPVDPPAGRLPADHRLSPSRRAGSRA
jgi:signal transduction histidine kinase